MGGAAQRETSPALVPATMPPSAAKATASTSPRWRKGAALSLPVASAVVGMPSHDMIRQNAELARNFQSMPAEEMRNFSRRMAAAHKLALDLKFREHADC